MRNKDEASAPQGFVKAEIAAARADLKTEIAATRADLKSEIAATKADLKSEIAATKAEIGELRRTISVEHAKLVGAMQDFKESISSRVDNGISRMLKLAEEFAVQVQKVDRHQIISDYRTDMLEGRVKTLEAPRSP